MWTFNLSRLLPELKSWSQCLSVPLVFLVFFFYFEQLVNHLSDWIWQKTSRTNPIWWTFTRQLQLMSPWGEVVLWKKAVFRRSVPNTTGLWTHTPARTPKVGAVAVTHALLSAEATRLMMLLHQLWAYFWIWARLTFETRKRKYSWELLQSWL